MTNNSVHIPGILSNDECPRCGNNKCFSEDKHMPVFFNNDYRPVKVPSRECVICKYTWLRHNNLNRNVVMNSEVTE